MCSTDPFHYRWLNGYIYSWFYNHHQIGSIHLSHCYHIFRGCVPEMFITSYSVTYCIYIPGKPGICCIIVQFMMSANSRMCFGWQIVFVCLYIRVLCVATASECVILLSIVYNRNIVIYYKIDINVLTMHLIQFTPPGVICLNKTMNTMNIQFVEAHSKCYTITTPVYVLFIPVIGWTDIVVWQWCVGPEHLRRQ